MEDWLLNELSGNSKENNNISHKYFDNYSEDWKLLILFGDTGSGKSTFLHYLERRIWKEWKNKNDYIPLFIALSSLVNDYPQKDNDNSNAFDDEAEEDIIKKTLFNYSFNKKEVGYFEDEEYIPGELEDYKFIFFFDGYDELMNYCSFYQENYLEEWNNSKSIISTRVHYFNDTGGYKMYLESKNAQKDLIIYMSPFSSIQQKQYLDQYTSKNVSDYWTTSKYLDNFNSIGGLKDIVKYPMGLVMVSNILPKIKQKKKDNFRIQISEVYDAFLNLCYDREIKKFKSSYLRSLFKSCMTGAKEINDKDGLLKKSEKKKIKSEIISHCISLASAMQKANITEVIYDDDQKRKIWEYYFDGNNENSNKIKWICRAAPLTTSQNRNQNQTIWKFIHESILEYYQVFEDHLQVDQNDFAKQNELMNLIEKLSFRPLTNESKLGFFADTLKDQKEEDKYWKILELTKNNNDPKISTAGLNAATILNIAKKSFSLKNLSGINVCTEEYGPNLIGAIFGGTNLEKANLSKAFLTNCNMQKANLSNTIVNAEKLGIAKYVINKNKILVNSISLHPNEKILCSGGNKLIIWGLNKNIPLDEINSEDIIKYVKFNHKGSLLAYSGWNNGIDILSFEFNDYEKIQYKKQCTLMHDDLITSIAFSNDDRFLITGGWDYKLKVWEINSNDVMNNAITNENLDLPLSSPNSDKTWPSPIPYFEHVFNDKILDIIISNDNEIFTITKRQIYILNLDEKEFKNNFISKFKFKDYLTCLAISLNDRFLAIGTNANSILLFNLYSKKHKNTFYGHIKPITALKFNSNNKLLVSASVDHTIKLWDIEKEKLLCTLDDHKQAITALEIANKSDEIYSASKDNTIKIWNYQKNEIILHEQEGHSNRINNLAIAIDNKYLISTGLDNVIKFWSLSSGLFEKNLAKEHKQEITCISVNENILVSGSKDATIKVWNFTNDTSLETLSKHTNEITSLDLSSDGNYLISAAKDNSIILWDLKGFAILKTFKLNNHWIDNISFSPNNKMFVGTNNDGGVHLYDITDIDDIEDEHFDNINNETLGIAETNHQFCFSNNSKYIFIPNNNNYIAKFNLEEEEQLLKPGALNNITSICLCPKSKVLAVGDDDNIIHLHKDDDYGYEMKNDDEDDNKNNDIETITKLKGHYMSITALSISPNGKYLVSTGGDDLTIKCWDINKGVIIWSSGINIRSDYQYAKISNIQGVDIMILRNKGADLLDKDNYNTLDLYEAIDYVIDNIKEHYEIEYYMDENYKANRFIKQHYLPQKFKNIENELDELKENEQNIDDNQFFLDLTLNRFIQQDDDDSSKISNNNVILVLSDNKGKTAFVRKLMEQLWSNYKNQASWIPLYIDLEFINVPVAELIFITLERMQIINTFIPLLKDNIKFLFICDSYDRINKRYLANRNFSEQFKLFHWAKSKLILLSRKQNLSLPYWKSFVSKKVKIKIYDLL